MASKTSKILKYKIVEYIRKREDIEGWTELNPCNMSNDLGWCDCSIRTAINELFKNDLIEFKYKKKGDRGRCRLARLKENVDYDNLLI